MVTTYLGHYYVGQPFGVGVELFGQRALEVGFVVQEVVFDAVVDVGDLGYVEGVCPDVPEVGLQFGPSPDQQVPRFSMIKV